MGSALGGMQCGTQAACTPSVRPTVDSNLAVMREMLGDIYHRSDRIAERVGGTYPMDKCNKSVEPSQDLIAITSGFIDVLALIRDNLNRTVDNLGINL